MTEDQKNEWLADMQLFIESAVESEQDEPRQFKLETELRIELIMTKLREIVASECNS
jgi:hypothetical protein